MDTENIDHIGIAVEDLEKAIDFYEKNLGMKLIDKEVLEDRGLKVAFLVGKKEDTAIELLEPINHNDENNTIAKFLKTRGPGLHHLAVRVNDIKSSLVDLSNKGLKLIDKEPRPGARGHLVAFIHPKSVLGVLLELVQEKS
ncbi:methylmalonyl-CoA epimerase [Acidianus sulfidivorans JP7]|uniref:Methylmalonyl-CoA epimerase n=1 Tax=Acidianus sulfidivorans JP7 TaxID=619593 RepID=A0A2U9IKT1_9CREN|nr:methylmalonyl-CoA epimerase [Acidianus sulfidivorans]AWR96623.1 methylmalonyl-CoA epimerase [Acidianus sulfidivorans JP7]